MPVCQKPNGGKLNVLTPHMAARVATDLSRIERQEINSRTGRRPRRGRPHWANCQSAIGVASHKGLSSLGCEAPAKRASPNVRFLAPCPHSPSCAAPPTYPISRPEAGGGRSPCEPGQVRKEAAAAGSVRVVVLSLLGPVSFGSCVFCRRQIAAPRIDAAPPVRDPGPPIGGRHDHR